jgi:hypothetical protein
MKYEIRFDEDTVPDGVYTWAELLEGNSDEPEFVIRLAAMKEGESFVDGGGAQPLITVTAVPAPFFAPSPADSLHCVHCDLHEENHGPAGECANAEARYRA